MILYFTGTGNSEFVAKRISERTGDEAVDLFEKIRDKDYSRIKSERPFVFVVPTYGWQIPHIVRDWIGHTGFGGCRKAYFVMTCGGDNGNAGAHIEKLCAKKGFSYMGCVSVVMPENYIAMFHAPEKEEAVQIIQKAMPEIDAAAEAVIAGQKLPEKKCTAADSLKSSLVNAVFYPVFVHSRKFYATDNCVGCGACEKVCPLSNVKLTDGKPVWGDNCTHCMACICRCPKEAVEYGKKTEGKPRYRCPM